MPPGLGRLRWWPLLVAAASSGAAAPGAASAEALRAPAVEPAARERRLGRPGAREGPARLAVLARREPPAASPRGPRGLARGGVGGAGPALLMAVAPQGPPQGFEASAQGQGGKGKWVRAGLLLFLLFAVVGALAALFFWIFQPQALLGRTAADALEDAGSHASASEDFTAAFSARADWEPSGRISLPISELSGGDADDGPVGSVSFVGRGGALGRGGSGGLVPDCGAGSTKFNMVASREIRHWIQLAKGTKLDIYTCLGLANGCDPLGGEVKAFIPSVLLLIVMQGVLPVLLLFIETKGGMYTVEQDPLFRLIGFILYLYSVLVLYEGAFDPCRALFLDTALQYNVSYSYILPMIFGECMNTFTAFFLARTLYLIFIDSHRPLELLIKCIAINFVIVIDNEWTTEHMRHKALRDFDVFQEQLMEEQERHQSFQAARGFKFYFQVAVKYFMHVSRVVGILIAGVVCAFLFLLANQDDWCRRLGNDMWPVCIPSSGAHHPAAAPPH